MLGSSVIFHDFDNAACKSNTRFSPARGAFLAAVTALHHAPNSTPAHTSENIRLVCGNNSAEIADMKGKTERLHSREGA